MRHIKKFKYDSNKMYISDYVLANVDNVYVTLDKLLKDIFSNFVNNTIGQLVSISKNWVVISYENIPSKIKQFFHENPTLGVCEIQLDKKNIVDYDMLKKELELRIQAKKYNL